ncbi:MULTISPECIES: hypothetical protein [Haloferacaceae]|uniref:DUF2254 domain-containing protein n=1 Tax=Halorubrum glutamatedens TaxID=2707018 RepID=A0ABD5QS29_9EURY|nr:hypothetical protein [Halobellus captivus]
MTDGSVGVKRWILLYGNRVLVAAAATVVVFVSFVAIVSRLSPPFVEGLGTGDPIDTLFGTMITVVVTGTTLVVTIGQLVLTQENGPLGDQRDRMSNSMDVRKSMTDLGGSPPSTDPATFLDDLVGVAADRAETLDESIVGSGNDPLGDAVGELAEAVLRNAGSVRADLSGARFGSFDVVSTVLRFDYGRLLARVERVRDAHGGRLSDRERELLRELEDALSLFGSAREHIKTLYFQWALIDLSRQILYAAVPALIVAGVTLSVVEPATFPGRTLGIGNVTLVVGAAFAVTLSPFMLFVSYVLRVLTVAKRTLAIEPLVLSRE